MIYKILTDEQQVQLREERIFTLEADHFRLSLLHEETPGNHELGMQVEEIKDRIAHHRKALKALEESGMLRAEPEIQEG